MRMVRWAFSPAMKADKVFFFVADAAWLKQSIVENRPPHKVANFLFPDPEAYRETLGDLHTFYLTHPETHVIPSHCEETISQFTVGARTTVQTINHDNLQWQINPV